VLDSRPVDTTPYADDAVPAPIQEQEEVPPVPPVVHTTISAILPRLKDFHDLLLNPPQVQTVCDDTVCLIIIIISLVNVMFNICFAVLNFRNHQ